MDVRGWCALFFAVIHALAILAAATALLLTAAAVIHGIAVFVAAAATAAFLLTAAASTIVLSATIAIFLFAAASLAGLSAARPCSLGLALSAWRTDAPDCQLARARCCTCSPCCWPVEHVQASGWREATPGRPTWRFQLEDHAFAPSALHPPRQTSLSACAHSAAG